jgi:hypothetical protein
MSDVDELSKWLREQLDEDWRVAGVMMALGGPGPGDPMHWNVDYLARWDLARVLAEVEAKRRMLDQLWDGVTVWDPDGWAVDFTKLLAQPYAGQPGWREEWRA